MSRHHLPILSLFMIGAAWTTAHGKPAPTPGITAMSVERGSALSMEFVVRGLPAIAADHGEVIVPYDQPSSGMAEYSDFAVEIFERGGKRRRDLIFNADEALQLDTSDDGKVSAFKGRVAQHLARLNAMLKDRGFTTLVPLTLPESYRGKRVAREGATGEIWPALDMTAQNLNVRFDGRTLLATRTGQPPRRQAVPDKMSSCYGRFVPHVVALYRVAEMDLLLLLLRSSDPETDTCHPRIHWQALQL